MNGKYYNYNNQGTGFNNNYNNETRDPTQGMDNLSIKSSSNSKLGMGLQSDGRDNILSRGRGDSSKWIEEERNRSLSRRGSSNSMEHKLESGSKLGTPGHGNMQNSLSNLSHNPQSFNSGMNQQGRTIKDPKLQALREETE